MSIGWKMPSSHFILCLPASPPALNLSQHQGLFQWVSSSHQEAEVLELQLPQVWDPKNKQILKVGGKYQNVSFSVSPRSFSFLFSNEKHSSAAEEVPPLVSISRWGLWASEKNKKILFLISLLPSIPSVLTQDPVSCKGTGSVADSNNKQDRRQKDEGANSTLASSTV